MIANCSHDENGRYAGGKPGDQTGTEWQVRTWYKYRSGWNCVIRFPGGQEREFVAELAEESAHNSMIGYSQSDRDSYGIQLRKAGYVPSRITVPCNTDCSKGVIDIIRGVGVLTGNKGMENLNASYTGNLRAGCIKAGASIITDPLLLTSDDYALRGDIYLNDIHHVMVNLSDGKKVMKTVNYAAIVNVKSYLQVRTQPSASASEYKLSGESMRLPGGMVVAICEEAGDWGRLNNVPTAWINLNYVRK